MCNFVVDNDNNVITQYIMKQYKFEVYFKCYNRWLHVSTTIGEKQTKNEWKYLVGKFGINNVKITEHK